MQFRTIVLKIKSFLLGVLSLIATCIIFLNAGCGMTVTIDGEVEVEGVVINCFTPTTPEQIIFCDKYLEDAFFEEGEDMPESYDVVVE